MIKAIDGEVIVMLIEQMWAEWSEAWKYLK